MVVWSSGRCVLRWGRRRLTGGGAKSSIMYEYGKLCLHILDLACALSNSPPSFSLCHTAPFQLLRARILLASSPLLPLYARALRFLPVPAAVEVEADSPVSIDTLAGRDGRRKRAQTKHGTNHTHATRHCGLTQWQGAGEAQAGGAGGLRMRTVSRQTELRARRQSENESRNSPVRERRVSAHGRTRRLAVRVHTVECSV